MSEQHPLTPTGAQDVRREAACIEGVLFAPDGRSGLRALRPWQDQPMPEPDAAQLFEQFERAFNAGSGDEEQRLLLMRSIGRAIEEHGRVPETLAATVRGLVDAWGADIAPEEWALDAPKREIWTALDAKNGNSTTIADATDRALRACLCLAELTDPAEAMESAGWAAEMLSAEEWPRPTRFF